jgi:4-carboxymuconolactone decarboxylase
MRYVTLAVLVFVGLGTALPESATAQQSALAGTTIDTASGSRLPLLRPEDMDDRASAQIYAAVARPDGEPPRGTIAIALYSPGTAAALGRIDQYLRTESLLGPRLFRLFSLITAREMNLAYEWSVHESAGVRSGLEPEVIDAIRQNGPLIGLDQDDALFIDFGRQLFRNRHVDSTTFAALVERLGRQQAFDAIMALTYPAMAGVMQRAVDQRPADGWDPVNLPVISAVGTPTGRPGEFVAMGPRPPLPADIYQDSLYRFGLLRRDELDPQTLDIFDRFVGEGQANTPRGPVGMTFLSPAFVEPVQQLNTLLRVDGVLDRRTSEIVITATGREMNSQYQWIVHGAGAELAGAGSEVLDAIRDDGNLANLDRRDAVVIEFTREIFRDETVRAETFDAAVNLFGVRGTVEIAELIGDYLMMTTVYNALGMRLRPEQKPTLPHRSGAPIGAEWR